MLPKQNSRGGKPGKKGGFTKPAVFLGVDVECDNAYERKVGLVFQSAFK